MARMQPFDVVGGAYSDDTRPWSVQDTVNYLVVNAERPGGRSPKMLRDAPGMVTFCASMPESSVRGLYVAEGRLFAVVGTSLYSIGTDGLATSLGTIPGVGRCVFTHNQITNGNEVVIGNGQSGYVYDTVAGTLAQITDEGFPGFRSVDFADQYVIGVEPFGRYWFHSDLADAKSYNTLDRAEAEKAPDRIMQAIATGSDVLVLGERTGQFFYNTGEATGTFQNRSGAEMDVGAASPWTACRLDNTVYWLGNDGSVYRLNGYVPQRISTHALEQAISRCNLSDAYAFTFEDRGHKCYLLTFPDGRTWCFDAATQEWTRRESYGFDRWRVSALVKWNGRWIGGDFINGKLYQLDWNVKQEAGEPLERRRVTGVLHDDQNRLIVNAFELVFDTGMDEVVPEMPTPAAPEPLTTKVALLPWNSSPPKILSESGGAFSEMTRTAEGAAVEYPSSFAGTHDVSPDGTMIAVASDGDVTLYEWDGTGYTYRNPVAYADAVACAFSMDAAHLAFGQYSASPISVRKVSDFTEIFTFGAAGDQAKDVAYSADGEHLAVACFGGTQYVRVFKRSGDTYTAITMPDTGASPGWFVAYNGDHLLLSNNANRTRIYKRAGDTYTYVGQMLAGGQYVQPAVSPDGTKVVLYSTVYTRSGDSYTATGNVTGTAGTIQGGVFDSSGRLWVSTQTGLYVCAASGADYVATAITGVTSAATLRVAVNP